MNDLSVAIKDLELKELAFNTIETTVKQNYGLNLSVTINPEKDEKNEFHVDFLGDFHIESAGMHIKGVYLFSIVIYNFEKIEEVEEFLREHEANIAFPMLSKISGLVAKISEEVRSFPLIIAPRQWIKDDEELEEDIDENKD